MKQKKLIFTGILFTLLVNLAFKKSSDHELASWSKPPGDITGNPDQLDVNVWGWQLFIALNWPAKPGDRGTPDPDRRIGDAGPVVWETWKSPEEVFWPDGNKPKPWKDNGMPKLPSQCPQSISSGSNQPDSILNMTTKASAMVVDRSNQAVGYSVTSQNGEII